MFDATKLLLLRRLELAGNAALNRVEGLSRLSALEELDLSGTAVGEELDLSSQHKLKRLRLVDAGQMKRVFGLGENPDLEYLDLSCSGLKRIPDDVRKLKKLVHVDLSNLSLEDLPDWLPELKLDFTYCDDGINLRRTSVVGIKMSLFNGSRLACQGNKHSYSKIKPPIVLDLPMNLGIKKERLSIPNVGQIDALCTSRYSVLSAITA